MIPVTVDRFYKNFKKKSISNVVIGILIISIFLILFKLSLPSNSPAEDARKEERGPTYMLHGHNVDSGYLNHVILVLERLGYRRVKNSSNFDLLWSHVYPFGDLAPFSKDYLQNLRPHQKVNHFPGSGYFTNKVDLATSDLKHVPRAFHLPDQKEKFLEYRKQNPNHLFVQKSNSHRGIKILKFDEINLNNNGTFVQEYVEDPLLVDGRKFDIGIYTILLSVDPLRVYIYNGDALLRFCSKKYQPFDPADVDRYVVGDDYVPVWKMPSLKSYYTELRYGMKESLNIYLNKQGKNPNLIWNKIEESIRTVFLKKESKIIQILRRYRSTNNFFEMVRFDFVVDSNLNVYLMEANMSPNLSSEHFPENRLLYENVLFNLFSLTGVIRETRSSRHRTSEEVEMEVPEKNLMVLGDKCVETKCKHCGTPQCMLCKNCLTSKSLNNFRLAYLEHINRKECKRIFPPTMSKNIDIDEVDLDEYSPENRLMMLWFLAKCNQDDSWC